MTIMAEMQKRNERGKEVAERIRRHRESDRAMQRYRETKEDANALLDAGFPKHKVMVWLQLSQFEMDDIIASRVMQGG